MSNVGVILYEQGERRKPSPRPIPSCWPLVQVIFSALWSNSSVPWSWNRTTRDYRGISVPCSRNCIGIPFARTHSRSLAGIDLFNTSSYEEAQESLRQAIAKQPQDSANYFDLASGLSLASSIVATNPVLVLVSDSAFGWHS